MAIKGFQGTSLLDFPGRIASLVFFSGCNMHCPYCHNAALVDTPEIYPDINLDDLLAMVEQRCGFIDGVVVSGGEPTLDSMLPQLLERLKGLDLLVKLDTNGLRPRVLEAMLEAGMVDFVSLDMKTAPQRYQELGAAPGAESLLQQSIQVLRETEVEIEYRTTCMPGCVETEDIQAIGATLAGSGPWVLQQFVPEYAMAEAARAVRPHSAETLNAFLALARQHVDMVSLRGL